MKKTIIATALAALTVTALSSASHAAPVRADVAKPAVTSNVEQVKYYKKHGDYRRHDEPRYLSQRDIIRNLYNMGFKYPRIVGSYRGAYVVYAYGYRGKVQLVVSARSGSIIKRTVLSSRDHRDRYYSYRKGDHRSSFTLRFGSHR